MQTRIAVVALLCSLPGFAYAGTFRPVPEPETLGLIAIGAVALVVAKWRRRK